MQRLERRLGKLVALSRLVASCQSRWGLSCLDDNELKELMVLARKVEDAHRTGEPVVWAADEKAVLTRLGAKAYWDGEAG